MFAASVGARASARAVLETVLSSIAGGQRELSRRCGSGGYAKPGTTRLSTAGARRSRSITGSCGGSPIRGPERRIGTTCCLADLAPARQPADGGRRQAEGVPLRRQGTDRKVDRQLSGDGSG